MVRATAPGMYVHLTARASTGFPFRDATQAARAWRLLRKNFPRALACVLMGNHLHLLTPSHGHPARTLRGVVGQLDWQHWEPVSDAEALISDRKIARNFRYVVLNPCRERLVDDPLSWWWSTYRGSMGAELDPWVSPHRVAVQFGRLGALHRYVSSDPSVHVNGTPPPQTTASSDWPLHPLADIVLAACSATRCDPAQIQRRTPTRRVFLQLARDQGWTQTTRLALLCRCHATTVRAAWRAPQRLDAARRCLADPRLNARNPSVQGQPGAWVEVNALLSSAHPAGTANQTGPSCPQIRSA